MDRKLEQIKEWANKSLAYLSRRTDYAEGYANGLCRAQEIINEILESEVSSDEMNEWFDKLLIRELVSTEEFFYIWDDYSCTNPEAFSDVATDVWYNGVDDEFRRDFYEKYHKVFAH